MRSSDWSSDVCSSDLVRFLDERRLPSSTVADVPMEDLHGIYLAEAATLGLRTGEMHRDLAIDTDDPAFRRAPLTHADMKALRDLLGADAQPTFDLLERAHDTGREQCWERVVQDG